MKALVAPLELKGTLSAAEAARAIARGIHRAVPDADVDLLPLADGGPGTVEALVASLGGETRVARVHDPLGRPVDATWGLARSSEGRRLGIIEMAAASGLSRLAPSEHDVRRATTRGTGELIRAALEAGCEELILGAGGSATNDGGAGALSALGARILDGRGDSVPDGGAALTNAVRLDLSGLEPRLGGCRIRIASDVTAPLLGAHGATRVFGPQKGADAASIAALEAGLAHWATLVEAEGSGRWRDLPGAGAAGGLAFGLLALGARIEPGFEVIAAAVRLDRHLEACDQVVTAEGRYDAQTALGKGPWRLAERARALGKPTTLLAGTVAAHAPRDAPFTSVVAVSAQGTQPRSAAEAEANLEEHAHRWASAVR